MDYLLRNAHTSFDQPLGKSSIANRALKRINPFSSVEGNRPLIQRQFSVLKKVVQQRSFGEEVVLVSLELVVEDRET